MSLTYGRNANFYGHTMGFSAGLGLNSRLSSMTRASSMLGSNSPRLEPHNVMQYAMGTAAFVERAPDEPEFDGEDSLLAPDCEQSLFSDHDEGTDSTTSNNIEVEDPKDPAPNAEDDTSPDQSPEALPVAEGTDHDPLPALDKKESEELAPTREENSTLDERRPALPTTPGTNRPDSAILLEESSEHLASPVEDDIPLHRCPKAESTNHAAPSSPIGVSASDLARRLEDLCLTRPAPNSAEIDAGTNYQAPSLEEDTTEASSSPTAAQQVQRCVSSLVPVDSVDGENQSPPVSTSGDLVLSARPIASRPTHIGIDSRAARGNAWFARNSLELLPGLTSPTPTTEQERPLPRGQRLLPTPAESAWLRNTDVVVCTAPSDAPPPIPLRDPRRRGTRRSTYIKPRHPNLDASADPAKHWAGFDYIAPNEARFAALGQSVRQRLNLQFRIRREEPDHRYGWVARIARERTPCLWSMSMLGLDELRAERGVQPPYEKEKENPVSAKPVYDSKLRVRFRRSVKKLVRRLKKSSKE